MQLMKKIAVIRYLRDTKSGDEHSRKFYFLFDEVPE
jgi:hypothetical protein